MRTLSLVSLCLCFAIGLGPAAAEAVPVDVDYTIQLTWGVPGHGVPAAMTGTGSQRLRFFNGTNGGHVSPGPIQIQSGGAFLSGSFSIGPNFFSGSQGFVNLGNGSGYASGAPFHIATIMTNNHVTQGFIHCSGPDCGSFGFASSVPVGLTSQVQLFSQVGTLFFFPSVGPQSFAATGTAGTFGGELIFVEITGQEVGRTVVPEPGTGSLVALGLVGLGLGGSLARRRRS